MVVRSLTKCPLPSPAVLWSVNDRERKPDRKSYIFISSSLYIFISSSLSLSVVKSSLFAILFWLNKDETCSPTIFPAHRTIYFSQLLKQVYCLKLYILRPNLFKFGNNNCRMKCRNMLKVNTKSIRSFDVFIVNFKYIWHISSVFFAEFEHIMPDGILYCLNLNLSVFQNHIQEP